MQTNSQPSTNSLPSLDKMPTSLESEQPSADKCPLHGLLSQVQIDIMSGICAGMLSTLVAHPLDTVKVRF